MNFRCIGKVKFKSEKQAKLAARRKDDRAWYFCDNCKYFHVGRSYQ